MQDYTNAEAVAARQRFEELVRTGVFKPCERFVCRDRDYEDRVQEALGATWRWYSQEAALGYVPDVALAVHACRLRMVDRSRRFVSGDRTRWRGDVFEQQGRGVELRRLDEVLDEEDDRDGRVQDPAVGLARPGARNPGDDIISAIDLSDWLDTLASTDAQLLEMRGAGFGLKEISKTTGRSVAGVFRRTHQLGADLAERAGVAVAPRRQRSRDRAAATGGAP